MSEISGLFGILAVAYGAYCIYAYYMVKVKGEIVVSLLLPKDTDVRKCKDIKGYCNEVQVPLLVLAIITFIYGAVDLYSAFVREIRTVGLIMVAIVLVALVFYSLYLKKINKKYFDL